MAGTHQQANVSHATSDDVRLAELRLGEVKVVEICRTIRRLGYALCSVVGVGLIAWASVQIATSPTSWQEVTVAALAPSSVIFIGYDILRRRANKRRIALENEIKRLLHSPEEEEDEQ